MAGWRGMRKLRLGLKIFFSVLAVLVGLILVIAFMEGRRWRMLTNTPQGLGIIFGFATLTAGHMINAWLTRRRDDRLRDHDARALAGALRAEMSTVRRGLLLVRRQITDLANGAPIPQEDFWYPEFPVFHGNIHRIGLLGTTLDEEVVNAVASIVEYGRINKTRYNLIKTSSENVKRRIAYIDWVSVNLTALCDRLGRRAQNIGNAPLTPDTYVKPPQYTNRTETKSDPPHPPTPV